MSRRAHRALLAGVDVDVLVRAPAVREVVDVRQREARLGAPAPPVPQLWPSNAVSMPSAVTPARMCAVADGRLPVSRCSSLRSSISLTGAFACCASFAQMMPCASGANLLPKPPPMYCVMTRTFVCGIRAPARTAARTDARACVDIHAVSLSPSHSHTRAVRFEAHVRDDVRGVGRFDDVRGLREAGVEIAGLFRCALRVLPPGNTAGASGAIACSTLARCGSASYCDADEPRRVARALFGVGRDRRDRIALIHHLRAGLLRRRAPP